jgi:peptidoglycan biosynthesis protein MviN/MurJ (putative lipid II flippase)
MINVLAVTEIGKIFLPVLTNAIKTYGQKTISFLCSKVETILLKIYNLSAINVILERDKFEYSSISIPKEVSDFSSS